MYRITIFLIGFMMLSSCNTPKVAADQKAAAIQAQKDEDGEYDLEVLDSQYQYFLNAIARPMSMFSEASLKTRNRMLVSEWNSYYYSGRYRNIIESSIDYDPNIDYGLKYEYKLYQVFAFVRWKYGLRLNGLSGADMR